MSAWVVWDFIHKLKKNPLQLEILGDGTQTKSYLMVDECISAMLFGLGHAFERVEVYNVGSEDQVNITGIARIVAEEMGPKYVMLHLTGGVQEGRGWIGDVKKMLLDISKLKSAGWKPRYKSAEAVRMATRQILQESG